MISILTIAIPCPIRKVFDYFSTDTQKNLQPGMRVEVPFGARSVVGIVLHIKFIEDGVDTGHLKSIGKCLDDVPTLNQELLALTQWISDYYHHPIGECIQAVLPKKLREGEKATLETEPFWKLGTVTGMANLGEKQRAIIALLEQSLEGVSQKILVNQLGQCHNSLRRLEQKKVIEQYHAIKKPLVLPLSAPCSLNQQQSAAVDSILMNMAQFSPVVLHGITGSGKTEVYIALTQQVLKEQKQVLVLIPEIGLTTQFVERFKYRIEDPIVVLNSSISDSERKQAWLLAKQGIAKVIIGTRSAVFTPLKNMGLIIVDEEHDGSYKQQDGLRYHARNVALVRAKKSHIPIVLGSASPSLESLYHVQQQHYRLVELKQRTAGALLPKTTLVDMVGLKANTILSSQLYRAITDHIAAGNQVLLFINRRGFAPILMCHQCSWKAVCPHCDAKLIVHQQRHKLCCHHCGYTHTLVTQCPSCNTSELSTYGAGTQQVETLLKHYFSEVPVIRIDRDSTHRVNAFSTIVETINRGEANILVGTQMLAKGHDFHNVTLVGVLDADQGLLSADFRATELLAQLITQVTGRAGRGQKKGEVIIQTSQPRHDFWQDILKKGYRYTADKLLQERATMMLPPIGSWCLIRAESKQKQLAMQLLAEISAIFQQTLQTTVMVMGPVPAIMEKKAGRYRAQLLLSSKQRKPLHQLLDQTIDTIDKLKLARKVRWSIDIDPIDLL